MFSNGIKGASLKRFSLIFPRLGGYRSFASTLDLNQWPCHGLINWPGTGLLSLKFNWSFSSRALQSWCDEEIQASWIKITSDEPAMTLDQQYIETLHFSDTGISILWGIPSTGTHFLSNQFKGIRRSFLQGCSFSRKHLTGMLPWDTWNEQC